MNEIKRQRDFSWEDGNLYDESCVFSRKALQCVLRMIKRMGAGGIWHLSVHSDYQVNLVQIPFSNPILRHVSPHMF